MSTARATSCEAMIPDDWSLLILPNSNRKYYYNHMTGESRWKVHIAGGPYDIPVFPKHPVEPERSTCTPQQKCHSLNDGLDSHRHHQKKSRQTAFLTPPRVDRHISRDDLPNSLPKPKPRKSSSITSRHRKSHSCVIGRSDPPINTIQNTSTSNHFVQRNAENETKPDNYNKDYIKLSEDYKRMEQFRSSQHPISTGPTPTCINCRSRGVRIDKVFFPCEHCCICLRCLKKLMPKKCPLCNETIRAIFDLDNAHESYWNWVEEVRRDLLYVL